MPEITEKLQSRRLLASRDGRISTFEMLFTVTGTMDQAIAKTLVDQSSPAVYGTGYPQFWKQTVEVRCIGHELWDGIVSYDTTAPEPLAAEASFEFSTGGGVQHITQSRSTVAYPASLPDQFGAIGVDGPTVRGVDIQVPAMAFAETHYFAELAPAYKRVLFLLTGHVNDAPFKGWEAGEVLFRGVDARRQDSRFTTPWVVTYRFEAQPNVGGLTIGAGTGIVKLGWHVLDVRHETEEGSTTLVKRAAGAYVHEVYPTASFAALGIGV